jgi:hypothetical protein
MCYRQSMGEDALNPAPDAPPPHSDDSSVTSEATEVIVSCPHCLQNVALDASLSDDVITCPHCSAEFSVPTPESAVLDYDDGGAGARRREAELDMIRIGQLTTARRAAIRARTYLLVGCVIFATAAVNLGIKTVQRVRYEHVWDARTFSFIAFGAACGMIAYYFAGKMIEISRELSQSAIEEPTTPPDFSTLSDGTQTARDLEDVK